MRAASRITKNTAAMEQAKNELVQQGVLLDWKKEERRAARYALEDVKYTLTAHPEFCQRVKAANARQRDAWDAKRSGPLLFQK